jgi:hypothetical protein
MTPRLVGRWVSIGVATVSLVSVSGCSSEAVSGLESGGAGRIEGHARPGWTVWFGVALDHVSKESVALVRGEVLGLPAGVSAEFRGWDADRAGMGLGELAKERMTHAERRGLVPLERTVFRPKDRIRGYERYSVAVGLRADDEGRFRTRGGVRIFYEVGRQEGTVLAQWEFLLVVDSDYDR